MVAPHTWRECRPAVLPLDGADPVDTEALHAAVNRVWVRWPPEKKKLFHEFCCHEQASTKHLRTMTDYKAAVAAQVAADARRHAAHSKKILDAMNKAGVQTATPQPGQTVRLLVIRVTDSMALGDDPPPYLAARRQITTCTVCGQNCFIDPKSYGQGIPEPICLRCVSPDTDEFITQAINAARGKP